MSDDNNGGAANELNVSPPPPPFYDGFTDAETKDWAAQGGFKSAEEVAQRARKFDAFKDADPANLAVLPGDDFNAQVEFARDRFGAPKEAAAYELDKIEGVDAGLATAAQEWFAEAGLTKHQAAHVAAKQMAFAKSEGERLAKEDKAAAERELTQLKSDWSTDYDAKRTIASRAFKAAGVSKETIDYLESGMGCAAVIKLGAFFGQFIKEGDFVDGDANTPPAKNMAESWYADS